MISTIVRRVLVIAALTLVYAMALASFDPWDLAIGAVFSTAVLLVYQRFLFSGDYEVEPGHYPPLYRRVLAFFPFALMVAWDITKGTWVMVLIVLHIRPLRRPGIILVPIGDRTPTGVVVTSLTTTLSPGSVVIDVDWDQGVMMVHAIDVTDPDEVRAGYAHLYEKYQRHVFP